MPIADDIHLSARLLSKNPGFVVISLVCIIIGIGVNIAVFSVTSALLLKPLPYPGADGLMMLFDTHSGPGSDPQPYVVSPPNYASWKRSSTVFTSLAAAQPASLSLAGEGEPTRIPGSAVSAEFFRVLGVLPALGRPFSTQEDVPPGRDVAIVSDSLWRERFGADRKILEKSIRLDGKSYTVVGVMPPGFDFPDQSRVWTPLALDPEKAPQRLFHLLYVLGRLRPEVSPKQAQLAMSTLARRLERVFPDTNEGWGVKVQPLRDYLVGDVRPRFLILQAAVALVLLIACANVANLILARFENRRQEFAVRAALGESRGQLVRQLFAEAVQLSLVGGFAGGLLAWIGTRAAVPLVPPEILPVRTLTPDARVLLFALGLILATCLLLGLVPVFTRSDSNLQERLAEGGRKASAGRGRHRILRALVLTETTLAMSLLVVACLLVRSLLLLQQVQLGYDASHLLTFRLSFPAASYPKGSQRVALLEEFLRRIEALPGVRSAGTTIVLPIGDRTVSAMFSVEGRPPASQGEVLLINNRMVSPNYLQTMRIPLLAGRFLTAADRADSQGVVVVSKEMARQYWPGQSALGKRVKRGGPSADKPWLTVVGVVDDVKDTSLDAKFSPTWYLPFTQHDFQEYSVVIRTVRDPLPLGSAVRQVIHTMQPDLAIERLETMEQRLVESLATQRVSTFFLAFFTGIGLVLAAAGIYGLLSYSVNARTHEIGIRMALGAQRRSVLGMVLRQATGLAVIGLLLGAVGGVSLSRLLASQLFAVTPEDPKALLGASLLLSTVALLASYLPANRATRVDVMRCFRGK